MTDRKQVEKRMTAFRALCRKQGLKATCQRLAIYRELAKLKTHPAAETVYALVRRQIPTISFDTIYRTLRMFENKGFIFCAASVGKRRRFDANMERHHHFICTVCGQVLDIFSKKLDQIQAQPEIAALGRIDSMRIKLQGTCADCRRKEGRRPAEDK